MDSIKPAPNPALDTLLFTYAKDGKFSVKKAYQLLKQDSGQCTDRKFWDWLWTGTNLAPKLKIFVWRCVKEALLVRAILSYRIRTISSLCPICKSVPETIMHTLFHCDFAKRAWLVSAVPLRTEHLVGNFGETIAAMVHGFSDSETCDFVSMAWAIWRMRNGVVQGGEKQSIEACRTFYQKERDSCQIKILTSRMVSVRQLGEGQGILTRHGQQQHAYSCYVDGSWSSGGSAGIGVYLLHEGKVCYWIFRAIQAVNPAQTEARALLEGYQLLIERARGEGIVFSDSKETVLALASKQPTIADWRSYHEIWSAWNIQAQSSHHVSAIHCGRDHPLLGIAHRLANQGRLYGWDKRGSTEPMFNLEEMV